MILKKMCVNPIPPGYLMMDVLGVYLVIIAIIICSTILVISITKAIINHLQHNKKINDAKEYHNRYFSRDLKKPRRKNTRRKSRKNKKQKNTIDKNCHDYDE